jgi:hypothetical protein
MSGISTTQEEQIRELLAKSQKVAAVKLYREMTGVGLKEAKDAVDAINAQMRGDTHTRLPSTPAIGNEPFAEDKQRNRIFVALVLFIVTIVIGGMAFFLLAGNGL